MLWRPPSSTLTDTRFPSTTLFRSPAAHAAAAAPGAFSAPPSRAAVSNAVTTFFDGSSGDDPDGFAAITGPSTSGFPDTPSMGGMSSPQRVTLPRPSLAIRALGNMSYGATASDIAAFNAIGSNDVERSEEHTSELQSLMRISYA